MKIKPLCPGCGSPMECNEPNLHVHETPESLRYICSYMCSSYKCGWYAPIGRGKTKEEALRDAYERAIRRAKDEEGNL